MNINKLSQTAINSLYPQKFKNFEKTFNEIKKQIEATYKIVENPAFIKSEKITAFRKAVKQEAEACINCEEKELLSRLEEIFLNIDLKSITSLKEEGNTSANNQNYKTNKAAA